MFVPFAPLCYRSVSDHRINPPLPLSHHTSYSTSIPYHINPTLNAHSNQKPDLKTTHLFVQPKKQKAKQGARKTIESTKQRPFHSRRVSRSIKPTQAATPSKTKVPLNLGT
jgi:hypothetical protein